MSKKPAFIQRQEELLKSIETAAEGTAVIVEGEGGAKEDQHLDAGKDVEKDDHKFDVLQAKYDIETKTLRDSFQTQANTIASLQDTVEELKKGTHEEEGEEPETLAKLDIEDFEGYGTEMADAMTLFNSQVDVIADLKKEVKELKEMKELKELKGSVDNIAGDIAKTSTDKFWDTVYTGVPEFIDFNGAKVEDADQRWSDFLDGVDPVSQMKRRDIALNAINQQDANHLIILANIFKETVNYKKPEKKAEDKLNSQLIPNVGGSGGPSGGGKKTVTKEEYNKAAKERQFKRISDEEFEKVSDAYIQSLRATG